MNPSGPQGPKRKKRTPDFCKMVGRAQKLAADAGYILKTELLKATAENSLPANNDEMHEAKEIIL